MPCKDNTCYSPRSNRYIKYTAEGTGPNYLMFLMLFYSPGMATPFIIILRLFLKIARLVISEALGTLSPKDYRKGTTIYYVFSSFTSPTG